MWKTLKARPEIANFALYNVRGVTLVPEQREGREKFYDGLASRQGTPPVRDTAIRIGKWETAPDSAQWKAITLDLTKYVTQVGQYELAFETLPGAPGVALEFMDWEVEMYGGRLPGAVELLRGKATFRLTRSQQTMDDFPTVFKVKLKSKREPHGGAVTIRRLTY